MRQAVLLGSGDFAAAVADVLARGASDLVFQRGDDPADADRASTVVAIVDGFDPEEVRALAPNLDAERLTLCFTTTRGLFVSPPLSPAGPCLTCLERRWLANLAFWEHAPGQERVLRTLNRHSRGLRSFPLPATAAHVAAELLDQRLAYPAFPPVCHYFDLISCELRAGWLLPVHGCPGCAPAPDPGERYLSGLAELARRVRP